MVNPLWRMGNQAGWHRYSVEGAAVEERDLVVVDVAVIPGCALGAWHALGGLGQEVHHVDAGGLHEQVHGRWQVHAVRRDDVVVGDVEGECEIVAAPALDIERIVLVEQRCRPAVMDQPDLVFVASVIVDGGWLGNRGLRRVERKVPAKVTGGWYPE